MRAALFVVLLAGCGGASARPAEPAEEGEGEVLAHAEGVERVPPPEETSPVPAGREDAAGTSTEPELAAAERAHAATLALPIGSDTPAADLRTALDEYAHDMQAAVDSAQAALELYGEHAGDPRLGQTALTRAGDLMDALAAHIAEGRIEVPLDLRQQIAGATTEVRTEVERSFHQEIRTRLGGNVHPLFCSAVQMYALAGSERGTAQLARYGERFIASCDSE